MKRIILHLFLIVCFLLISLPNSGLLFSKSTYYYKQLGIKEGLSQSRVQCILSDYKGYLWIGTESGLNRYDQNYLKHYLKKPEDKNSLPSDNILFMVEDKTFDLWVATTKGLCVYNRITDDFEPVFKDNNNLYVTSYLLSDDGILFAGERSIYKYDYASQQVKLIFQCGDQLKYTPFFEMIRYNADLVYLNTRWNGVYSYHLKTGAFEKVDYLSEIHYSTMFVDSHNRLWTSLYGNGLLCYQNGKLIKHFTTENSSLTYNVVFSITEKNNKLWVGTDGGGINIISLNDFSFKDIMRVQDDMHSFPANSIYRLYKDALDNIWAGSIRNGLIGIRETYANSYQNVPFGNPYGLSNQTINEFFQDSEGLIWIGTDGGGLNSFDIKTRTFKHYPTVRHEKIVSIIEYSSRELLFHSFNKGLFIFDKKTGKCSPFVLVNKEINEKACVDGFSVNIQRLSGNKILFSSQHIIIYDIETKKFEMVATRNKDFSRMSPLVVANASDKTYLADLKNICMYDAQKRRFEVIYRGQYVINDVSMDQEGLFWIASESGLVRYDHHNKQTRLIQTSLFNEAISVIVDKQRRVWIGTRRNLYVYFPDTEKFAILGEVDGVLPNEYIFHSTLLTEEGNILVGGTVGMTVINKEIGFEPEVSHSVELQDVLLDGRPVPLQNLLPNEVEEIQVPWNFTSLHLKVLLNNKDVFRKKLFRFYIEGIDKEMIQSNSLIINHLSVGEYTVSASYYTQSGEWSKMQKILHVVVNPPWWKTNWFYGGVAICISICIYLIVFAYHRKRRMRQQKEIVKLKNKMYEDKINFLTNISHELRTPLTLICSPLKRIINNEVERDKVEHQLTSVYSQANQMKNIIDMVLDVRKLEEGKSMLHILSCSMNEWVQIVGNKFAIECEAKEIRLEYHLDERVGNVSFDQLKCEFVLSNFLINALKFSESQSVITLTTELLSDENWLRVSVNDQGMGLNMVDTEALFSNFYQGTHGKGGSGIGLSYAKSLITYHGGRVGVFNNPVKGATFYFDLPLTNEANLTSSLSENILAERPQEKTETVDYAFLKNYSILVVEDALDLRNYLKDVLAGYFAKVYFAVDGKEGLELIEKRLPDIVVSDVMMPRMNGFDLCKKVKSDLCISHIPFILLTAYHNTQNMNTGYKLGADGFLPKPFEIDGLLALIHNLLKFRERIKQRYQEGNASLTCKEVSFSNADETFLLKLNTLINDNMSHSGLDVAFLATHMCISRSLLFNKVKAITGMGIVDYVNQLRIEKATVLLATTDMSLTEVGEVVGFSSLRYFSKVFKTIKGEIPSNFRNKLRDR